jgi:hypothetical protein
VSWSFDPHAIFTDTFTISWSEFKPYIFPPFSLIGKVMLKIMSRHDDKITLADSVEIPLSSNAFLRQHKRLNSVSFSKGVPPLNVA